MRKEETTPGAKVMEEEQFLVFANLPVVAFCCFHQEGFVFNKLFFVGE